MKTGLEDSPDILTTEQSARRKKLTTAVELQAIRGSSHRNTSVESSDEQGNPAVLLPSGHAKGYSCSGTTPVSLFLVCTSAAGVTSSGTAVVAGAAFDFLLLLSATFGNEGETLI